MNEVVAPARPEPWHITSRRVRKLFDFLKGAETPTITNNPRATLQLRAEPTSPPSRNHFPLDSPQRTTEAPSIQGARSGSASHFTLSDESPAPEPDEPHTSDIDATDEGNPASAESNEGEELAGSVTIILGPTALSTVYNIEKNIFVAKRGLVQVPRDAIERFDKEVKQRLINDLREVREQLSRTSGSIFALRRGAVDASVYEPVEIRMSGRATGGEHGQVTLLPTIWVRCPTGCRRKMKKALRDPGLAWTKGTGFGKIMVADSASLLAATGSRDGAANMNTATHSQGLALGAGLTLHVHVAAPPRSRSANGLICRATLRRNDGTVQDQFNYSRLGGVLYIDGRPVGITSAHRILDGAWHALIPVGGRSPIINLENSKAAVPDADGTDVESITDLSTIGSRVSTDYQCYDAYRLHPSILATATISLDDMVPVEIGEVLNLAGIKVVPVQDGRPHLSIVMSNDVASDFALVDISGIGDGLVNEYEDERGLRVRIHTVEPKASLSQGPVTILLSPNVEAELLTDAGTLEIAGTSVSTRLLQLECPLGKKDVHVVPQQ